MAHDRVRPRRYRGRDPLVVDERGSFTTHAEGAADRYCIQVAVR
jgi:hypothetical protein